MFGIKKIILPVEVSARHLHLCKKDLEVLFGLGYELKVLKQLSQPHDFACQETISIRNNSHILENVRIVGPLRERTQVEVSKTDAVLLGLNAPVRLSGNLEGSAPVTLQGPVGKVELPEGLIVARRHLHCSTQEAKEAKLKSGSLVSVEIKGERALTFHCVEVRVGDDYKMCLHLDTDEGNAAGINRTGQGVLHTIGYKAKEK